VAYYESQRKGESIHSPETCLPGGGWEFQQAGTVELTSKDRRGSPMRVNKALLVKGDSRQLSYFWFPQRDRVLTKAWQLKVYNFWDAILTGRTDGALVRVVTPLYPGEEIEDANRRLMAITKELVPVLNQFLPQ
jgi:EpsI family protein